MTVQKVSNIRFKDIEWRLKPVTVTKARFKTGYESFDNWVGGLPYGLTIFVGGPGCGKSLIARLIAQNAETCLYFCCEVINDAPNRDAFPNVLAVDYTNYKVNFNRALEELDAFIEEMKPKMVIIDSLTSFLSITNKALPESDLRDSIGKIHTKYEGKLPIIGISEIRGTGYNESAAGGVGVMHSCSLLVHLEHIYVDFPSQSESYGVEIGDDIYTIKCVKDKHGLAKHKEGRVIYDEVNKNDFKIVSARAKKVITKPDENTVKVGAGWKR